jgi:hypothetical protein
MKKPYYTQEQREFIRFYRTAKGDFMMLHLETMKFRRELENSWKRSKFYKIYTLLPSRFSLKAGDVVIVRWNGQYKNL